MNFAEAAKLAAKFTRTENGAVALNTTGDARLDFFGTAGSLRGADKERITRLFSEAYKEDPLFATKIAFYARGADLVKDRPSVRSCSLWQNIIRRHFV